MELPNIDSSTLKMLFYFIYTGRIRATLIKYLELSLAPDYFDINALKTPTTHFKLCLNSCVNKHKTKLWLSPNGKSGNGKDVQKILIGEEIEGCIIDLFDGYMQAQIGEVMLRSRAGVMVHDVGDQICILLTSVKYN